MNHSRARLAAWALIVGSIVASAGYLTGFVANGTGDDRFAGPTWALLYSVALFGDVLVVLGLPAVLTAHGDRASTSTTIGYAGTLAALVVLNVGEGCIEGFVKPYLAMHGGLPQDDLPGLMVFEAPGLLGALVGLICLGIAVLRAQVLPSWVGVAFLASAVLAVVGLPVPWSLLSDYVLFAGLVAVGVHVLRAPRPAEAVSAATPAPPSRR